jgi:hypothetical protein
MVQQFESSGNQNQEVASTIVRRVRPDGVRYVELVTKSDTYSIMLRDGEPFITSSTNSMSFGNLSPADQRLVENALRQQQ